MSDSLPQEARLIQRRDEIEREHPDGEHLRMGLRQFDPGPWIYELEHPDGRVETLTVARYYELLHESRQV